MGFLSGLHIDAGTGLYRPVHVLWEAEAVFRTVRSRIVVLLSLVVITAVVLTAVTVSLAVQRAAQRGVAQSLRNDADIYQMLLNYGITHNSWDGVEQEVRNLASKYDRRIALGTQEHGIRVDSDRLLAKDSGELNTTPQVVIDPRNPLTKVADPPQVIHVAPGDGKARAERVGEVSECLLPLLPDLRANHTGEGPDLTFDAPVPTEIWPEVLNCLIPVEQPLPTASTDLGLSMEWLQDCLAPTLGEEGWVSSDSGGIVIAEVTSPRVEMATKDCLDRHLDEATAPPVQLYLGTMGGAQLSLENLATVETALIVACIIAVAGVAGVMLASRIVKPLRTLTAAATELGDGARDVRVEVPDRSEIGALAETFNSMAESLERSEQARRQLIADIAHELGNPLVTIGGGLEAIQDGVYEPSPEVIASLAEEASHLQRLITDLRELALADTGSLPIARSEVDLGEVVAATVAAHTPIAKAVGVELVVEGAGCQRVLGDETRLRQVLANLLGNAIHHTPAGGVVTVRMSAPPGKVRLEVVDTGEGIRPEHLPHIFERFWRADSSRYRDGGRTGLGLAISDTLIRAQGGTIDVASTLGVGTAFTIELPA